MNSGGNWDPTPAMPCSRQSYCGAQQIPNLALTPFAKSYNKLTWSLLSTTRPTRLMTLLNFTSSWLLLSASSCPWLSGVVTWVQKDLSALAFPFLSRGTQKAHLAVSNEALCGVLRISGRRTCKFSWSCWWFFFFFRLPFWFSFSKLFASHDSSMMNLRISIDFTYCIQLYFKCLKHLGVDKFFWFCTVIYSWPSINIKACEILNHMA